MSSYGGGRGEGRDVVSIIAVHSRCGVLKDDLLLRLAPEETEQAVSEPHVRPFAMGGRAMKGWNMIAPDGVKTDEKLSAWVRRGASFASSLPKK